MTDRMAFTQRFHHPVEVVFGYLTDPRTRPEWQSSLRRVELLTEQVSGTGTRWRDITWAGIAPLMEVTTHEHLQAWAEDGTWRQVTAYLSLTFLPQGEETDVGVVVRLKARGLLAAPAALASLLTPVALRSDLKRADRVLTERLRGQ